MCPESGHCPAVFCENWDSSPCNDMGIPQRGQVKPPDERSGHLAFQYKVSFPSRDCLAMNKNRHSPPLETVSQFAKTVIPGEPNDYGRDPESRKPKKIQNILDPGSHPAPRDLAGMTNCDTASFRRGISDRDMVSYEWISVPRRRDLRKGRQFKRMPS